VHKGAATVVDGASGIDLDLGLGRNNGLLLSTSGEDGGSLSGDGLTLDVGPVGSVELGDVLALLDGKDSGLDASGLGLDGGGTVLGILEVEPGSGELPRGLLASGLDGLGDGLDGGLDGRLSGNDVKARSDKLPAGLLAIEGLDDGLDASVTGVLLIDNLTVLQDVARRVLGDKLGLADRGAVARAAVGGLALEVQVLADAARQRLDNLLGGLDGTTTNVDGLGALALGALGTPPALDATEGLLRSNLDVGLDDGERLHDDIRGLSNHLGLGIHKDLGLGVNNDNLGLDVNNGLRVDNDSGLSDDLNGLIDNGLSHRQGAQGEHHKGNNRDAGHLRKQRIRKGEQERAKEWASGGQSDLANVVAVEHAARNKQAHKNVKYQRKHERGAEARRQQRERYRHRS